MQFPVSAGAARRSGPVPASQLVRPGPCSEGQDKGDWSAPRLYREAIFGALSARLTLHPSAPLPGILAASFAFLTSPLF